MDEILRVTEGKAIKFIADHRADLPFYDRETERLALEWFDVAVQNAVTVQNNVTGRAQVFLADTLARFGYYERAEEFAEQSVRDSVYAQIAIAAAENRDYYLAARYARRAGRVRNFAHGMVAIEAELNGDYEFAERQFRKVGVCKDLARAELAGVAARNKDYKRAQRHVNQAGGKRAQAHEFIAREAAFDRDYERAERHVNLTGNLQNSARAIIAWAAAENGDYELAEQHANQAGPLKDLAHAHVARGAAKNRNYELAEILANKACHDAKWEMLARESAKNFDVPQAHRFIEKTSLNPDIIQHDFARGSLQKGLIREAAERAQLSLGRLTTYCLLAKIIRGVA